MSENCPVCGCKTEALDFTDCEISAGKVFSVCSYCSKQVKILSGGDADPGSEKTQSALRWLDAVLVKDVTRSAVIEKALADMRSQFPAAQPQEQVTSGFQPGVAEEYALSGAAAVGTQAASDSERIAELEKRLTALEVKLKKQKRNKLILTALELIIPMILVGILVIIFLNSSLWDSLVSLTSPSVNGLEGLVGF